MTDSTKEAPDTPIATETHSIDCLDREAEKKVVWKCDLYVVPILSFLMCLGFLDRINIGNARLQGLERDLNMSGHDFNIALFIFFIPYMVFEVPSNIILKKVAPSTWLSGVMIGWGMDGICGYSGWRWIFILEGAVTVVAAAVSKFFIPDWPETAKFLTEDERKILIHRLATESENSRMDRLDKPAMKRAFTDVKIYLGIIMYMGIVNSGYAVSFFTPTILHDLGWTALNAQLLAVPIFACGACSAMITAVISDRIRHRFTFTILGCLIASIGYTILLCQQYVSLGVRYFAVFAISAGSFMSHPITITWLNNNMGGHYKRGISSAMQIGIGNSGGIIASNLFFPSEAPRYPTGYGASLGLIWLCALTCIVFLLYLYRENRLRAQGRRDHLLQLPEDEVNNLGDHHPSFKFTY
ncbi:hypothetical protein RJZ90_006226 [Blastomyces dermatitidis]